MIQEKILRTALGGAEDLVENKILLSPRADTLLAELGDASRHDSLEVNLDDNIDMGVFLTDIAESTMGDLDNLSQHDLVLEGAINDLSKVVTQHLSFARNVVKPLIVDMASDLSTFQKNNTPVEASSEFDIKSFHLPGLLKDVSFLDSLRFYQDKPVIKPTKTVRLEDKEFAEIVGLMSTGSERTDADVLAMVSTMEEETIVCLWRSFFTIAETKELITVSKIDKLNVYEKANYTAVLYLLTRKLLAEVESSSEQMSLVEYNELITDLRDYAGSLLLTSLTRIGLLIRTNQLILRNTEHKVIELNGEVYNTWLTAGGSPETILGLMVSGETISNSKALDLKAKDYSAVWNSYVMFHNSNNANRAFDEIKSYLSVSFNKLLAAPCEEEKTYAETHPNYFDNVKKLLEEEVDSLSSKDLEDVYDVSLRLIAKVRFYYTSAFVILTDINDGFKANPDIEVREAALLATVNYISNYLADQIAVN